jgi:phosphoglycolate phosphatase-like HAD superfamily hydrolase
MSRVKSKKGRIIPYSLARQKKNMLSSLHLRQCSTTTSLTPSSSASASSNNGKKISIPIRASSSSEKNISSNECTTDTKITNETKNINIVNDLELIIWDIDGTLCDSTDLAFKATNYVLKKFAHEEISEREYKFGSRYTTPERFSLHVSGSHENEKERGRELGEEFDLYYVKLVNNETAKLFSGIRDIIITLMGKRVRHAALSNACGAYARACVRANELDEIFEVTFGADDVSKAKPAPDGILEVCNRLNVRVQNSVYIGDAPSDGKAARSAGCFLSIGCSWGSHDLRLEENRAHFDIIFETREELHEYLCNSNNSTTNSI